MECEEGEKRSRMWRRGCVEKRGRSVWRRGKKSVEKGGLWRRGGVREVCGKYRCLWSKVTRGNKRCVKKRGCLWKRGGVGKEEKRGSLWKIGEENICGKGGRREGLWR